MSASKFALPLGLAVLCVASLAAADKTSDMVVRNATSKTQVIDIAVGNSADCDANKVFWKTGQSIPAGGTYKLEIKPPRPKFACFRMTGTTSWLKQSTKGGNDEEMVIK